MLELLRASYFYVSFLNLNCNKYTNSWRNFHCSCWCDFSFHNWKFIIFLQYKCSSIAFYGNFNLHMDRSPGFGSTACNYSPCSDSISLRLRSSSFLTSLHTYTRRTVLQKVRHRTLTCFVCL